MLRWLRQQRARKQFGSAWNAHDPRALKLAAEAMIAAFPDDYRVQNDLGMAWLDLGDSAAAETYFRRAIQLNENAIGQNNLGRALLALGKCAEARAAFLKAVELDPNDPQPQYNQVVLLRDENKSVEAETELHAFIAKFPNHAGSQNDLGLVWEQRGDADKALACYARAIAINPGYVPTRLNLIRLLCEQRRFPESTPHMEALARMGMNFFVDKQGNEARIDINGKPFFRGPAT